MGDDHPTWKCTSSRVCKACNKPDHQEGNEHCPAYEKLKNVIEIDSGSQILSNFARCPVRVQDVELPTKEHAFQYIRAKENKHPDIAEIIATTTSPFEAKKLGQCIPTDSAWDQEHGKNIMKKVIDLAVEDPDFKEALIDTGSDVIAQALPGEYVWSAGLDKDALLFTRRKFWTGGNQFGDILMEARKTLRSMTPKKSTQPTVTKWMRSHVSSRK